MSKLIELPKLGEKASECGKKSSTPALWIIRGMAVTHWILSILFEKMRKWKWKKNSGKLQEIAGENRGCKFPSETFISKKPTCAYAFAMRSGRLQVKEHHVVVQLTSLRPAEHQHAVAIDHGAVAGPLLSRWRPCQAWPTEPQQSSHLAMLLLERKDSSGIIF